MLINVGSSVVGICAGLCALSLMRVSLRLHAVSARCCSVFAYTCPIYNDVNDCVCVINGPMPHALGHL